MQPDWLTNFLPVLNATGIPLLAVGVILLVRAYQKSIEAYKDSTTHLAAENEKLRERLRVIDASYFDQIEKAKTSAAKSFEAIEELYARKVSLLSETESASTKDILSDVKNINQAIELIRELSSVQRGFNSQLHMHTTKMDDELAAWDSHFKSLSSEISRLADRIGDTASRVIVVSVVTSAKVVEAVKAETQDRKRGLIVPVGDAEKQEQDNEETLSLPPPEFEEVLSHPIEEKGSLEEKESARRLL